MHATEVYVDATSGTGGNTYNNDTNSLTDWSVTNGNALTTDNKWGIRNAGSGTTGYNSNICELYASETGATLRTEITGLLPSATYTGLRVYMLGSTTANYNWTLDFSLDGVNWTTLLDYDAVGFTGTIVDTANSGVGVPLTGTLTGTRRFWHSLPAAATDATGTLRIFIRRGTGAANRSSYDGIGYDNTPVAIPADPYSDSVAISEFMADNPGPVVLPGSVSDMDGDSSDWIEFHNSGTTAADLSGWSLTDDPLLANKWVFPTGTILTGNARLLVFASGKNRQINGVELHANFKLAKLRFSPTFPPRPIRPGCRPLHFRLAHRRLSLPQPPLLLRLLHRPARRAKFRLFHHADSPRRQRSHHCPRLRQERRYRHRSRHFHRPLHAHPHLSHARSHDPLHPQRFRSRRRCSRNHRDPARQRILRTRRSSSWSPKPPFCARAR